MTRTITRLIPLVLGLGLLFAVPAQARNYDCSKAGNANKAVCKGAATGSATTTAKSTTTTATTTARHYDCSKAGNANKAVCKGSATTTVTTSPPAPTKTVVHTTTTTNHTSVSTSAAGPSGATAKCKDGTYSHSATRSGTCSHHGGVATWY
jgi:hypothetical protein